MAASWDAATTAGNAWNTATALAQVAFVSAGYSAQTTAIAGLVSAMPSGAAGKDWAQFRSDLASAQETWWGNFSPTILTNTYAANLSATAYQDLVDASYLSASTSASQADAAYIVSQAQAQDNQISADARANSALAISTADAIYQAGLATAHDLERFQVSQAGGSTYTSRTADDAAAGATYTLAIANANATHRNTIAFWLAGPSRRGDHGGRVHRRLDAGPGRRHALHHRDRIASLRRAADELGVAFGFDLHADGRQLRHGDGDVRHR